MGQLKAFANTKISMHQTQDDLDELLLRRGIMASRWSHFAQVGDEPGQVRFEFEWQKAPGRVALGFRVEVAYKTEAGPKGGRAGTTREQGARALYWHVKNLFDAVDFGLVELDQAFMPHLLLPSGATAYEQLTPHLDRLEAGDVPALLTDGAGGGYGALRGA